jgi:diacylglycerol kinase
MPDENEPGRVKPKPPRAAFLQSFVYAFSGLSYAIRTQRNARVHLVIALLAIGMGIWLRISPVEWGLIFVAITGVFIAEMLNTVVEACVDLATQKYHPLAKVAKDVAAGTVLLNAILSIIIGLFVFGPHLFPMIARLFGQ